MSAGPKEKMVMNPLSPVSDPAKAVSPINPSLNPGRIAKTPVAIAAAGLAVALFTLSAPVGQAQGFVTSVPRYAVPVSPEYEVLPILSVGDVVPHSSGDPSKGFQMIGVPDGLGACKIGGGGAVVYMNHEVAGNATNRPVIGEPRYRGAFVSKFVLNANAEVVSGELAYDVIVDPAGNEVPPAREDNTTPAFVRFCSGTLAWLDAGFDRPIYFCGEENPAPATFDPKGGLATAIFDNKLYTLPHLGHFQHENTPVRPQPDPETVLVLMEDSLGPVTQPYTSQLYLYVGEKDFTPGAHPLARNGLVGGRFYVFVPTTAGVHTEADFQSGSISGQWTELSGVAQMTEAQLEAASQAAGAFSMIKAEDGAWSKRDKNQFFFNSTGDTINTNILGNHLGRTYRLDLNEDEITGPCTLTILYNADQVYAAGGDIAFTPDNLDASKDYVMVCEDGTGFSRNVMAGKGRTGLIWRYDLKNNYAATKVVSLATSGRDGLAIGAGVWETSGIIDAEHLYGRNTWLFNVQAHPPTAAPAPNTTEDGQLLLLVPVK
jgi:hypothetical protein